MQLMALNFEGFVFGFREELRRRDAKFLHRPRVEAVNKGMEMTLSEGLYLEAVLFGVACATEDKKEGTTAFLEKRAAAFKGK